MSNFREAAKLIATDLRCEKCDAVNLPAPAKPTIVVEPNGRATCDACGHVWTHHPKKEN